MSVPDFMRPPPPDHPDRGGDWFPHVISQEVVGDGTVLVTWALPNLHRATVRVPVSAWLDGDHGATGAFLGTFILPLLPNLTQAHDNQDDDDDG